MKIFAFDMLLINYTSPSLNEFIFVNILSIHKPIIKGIKVTYFCLHGNQKIKERLRDGKMHKENYLSK